MNREKIEYLLTLKPDLVRDSYRDSVVDILTPPKWYRPLARRRFYQDLDQRTALVMAEYAKDLIHALIGGETKTTYTPTTPTETTLTPTPHRETVAAEYKGPGSGF